MTTPPSPTPPSPTPLDAALFTLRDVPPPSAQIRDAHIAHALSHVSSHTNVSSLQPRRRPRLVVVFASVAAAGLFAVGIGIGRVSSPTDSTTSKTLVKNATRESLPIKSSANTSNTSGCVTDPDAQTFVLGTPPAWVLAVRVVDGVRIVTVFNARTCAIEWQLPANK